MVNQVTVQRLTPLITGGGLQVPAMSMGRSGMDWITTHWLL